MTRQRNMKPKRGRPPSESPEPIESDPVPSEEFEEAVKEVLLAPLPGD